MFMIAAQMTPKRLTAALLTILAVILLFGRLGKNALLFDEAIYAQVSKETAEQHDWPTPYYNGKAWFEKSPTYFWLTSLLFKLFGVSEFWARFVSAVSGLGVLLLSYLIARRIYSHAAGILSVLILISTQLFVYYARFGTTDTMLTLCLLLAVYGYLRAENDQRFWLLVGAACGFAMMVKGLGGITAPLVLLIAAIVDGRVRATLRSKWVWIGAGLALLIVLPWHLQMYRKHGQAFIQVYMFRHVVNRATANINQFQRGFGYYFVVLREFCSPWVYLLPFALIFRRTARSAVILILGLTIFIFYTIVQTKFQWYILPSVPAFAIAIAGFVAGFMEKTTTRKLRLAALALIVLWTFGVVGVLNRITTVSPEIEAAARLAKRGARDQGGIMAYPENLQMTVKFYSNRKLCTDPAFSKLSHGVTTECAPAEATHIILRKSDWDKIASSFTITPAIEDGPLTYASITRR